MTTKIGLVSDVHASPQPLAQALELFKQQSVSKIICAGDIAGYFDNLPQTIKLLRQNNCDCIIGNHDQSYLSDNQALADSEDSQYLNALPESLEYSIEGKHLYVVHAHPPTSQHGGIKLLDQRGAIIQEQLDFWDEELCDFKYDVLIVGHTHQVFAERIGNTLLLNPGSSQFNHSCMVLSLPDLEVKTYALGDQEIVKCWNFSYLFSQPDSYPSRKNN